MRAREACEQDADEACAVIRRSITELCAVDHQGDAATLEAWLANKTPANVRAWIGRHHVLVADDDGAILGVAAMSATGEVLLNYVAPEARFRGISKGSSVASKRAPPRSASRFSASRARRRRCASIARQATRPPGRQ